MGVGPDGEDVAAKSRPAAIGRHDDRQDACPRYRAGQLGPGRSGCEAGTADCRRMTNVKVVAVALFPGAGHLESWNINQAGCTSLLTSFLSPVAPS